MGQYTERNRTRNYPQEWTVHCETYEEHKLVLEALALLAARSSTEKWNKIAKITRGAKAHREEILQCQEPTTPSCGDSSPKVGG